jgi:hypothetical protein
LALREFTGKEKGEGKGCLLLAQQEGGVLHRPSHRLQASFRGSYYVLHGGFRTCDIKMSLTKTSWILWCMPILEKFQTILE